MYGRKWWLCWKISVQCGRELNFLHSDITVIILHGQILILYLISHPSYVFGYHESKYFVTLERNFLKEYSRKPPKEFSVYRWHKLFYKDACTCEGKISGKQFTEGKVVEVSICSLFKQLPGNYTCHSRQWMKNVCFILTFQGYKYILLQNVTAEDKDVRCTVYNFMPNEVLVVAVNLSLMTKAILSLCPC